MRLLNDAAGHRQRDCSAQYTSMPIPHDNHPPT
jgi:hypothetical protein